MTLISEPLDPAGLEDCDQRQGPRYPSARQSVGATIVGAGQEQPCRASVIDLSPSGAKITVAAPLIEQAEATLRIKSSQTQIEKAARICWCRPARFGWWVGVDFLEPLPQKQLNELAVDGLVDRRRDERFEQAATLQARLELADTPLTVELRDVSTGGLRISSPVPMEPGQRVLLNSGEAEELTVVVRVQWMNPLETGCDVGCAFIDREGRQRFDRLLDLQLSSDCVRDQPQTPRRPWGLVLCVAAIAVMGLCFRTRAFLDFVAQWTSGQ